MAILRRRCYPKPIRTRPLRRRPGIFPGRWAAGAVRNSWPGLGRCSKLKPRYVEEIDLANDQTYHARRGSAGGRVRGNRFGRDQRKRGCQRTAGQKVREAMEALDYYPDQVARSLKVGRTDVIGMVVPDITHIFFPLVIRGAEDAARKHGYSVILCDSEEDAEEERRHLNTLFSRRVDGVLIACSRPFHGLRPPSAAQVSDRVRRPHSTRAYAKRHLQRQRRGGLLRYQPSHRAGPRAHCAHHGPTGSIAAFRPARRLPQGDASSRSSDSRRVLARGRPASRDRTHPDHGVAQVEPSSHGHHLQQ